MKNLFCISILIALTGCNVANPNSGDKIGQIAKVQRAGLICTTTEILVTGKFGGGELKLTVPDRLLEKAKAANDSQEFVKITYHTDFVNTICGNATHNVWVDSIDSHAAGAP